MSTISAHPVSPIEFNEDTIRAIFGHEAAEDETIERLKSYYLKTNIYNSMNCLLYTSPSPRDCS